MSKDSGAGSPLQIPVLRIDVEKEKAHENGKEAITIYYSIFWEAARGFGPESEPEWLRIIREGNPFQVGGIIRRPDKTVSFEVRKDLSSSLREILHAAQGSYRPETKESVSQHILTQIQNYSDILTRKVGIPRILTNYLKNYSETCTEYNFPPILTIQTDFSGILWHLAALSGVGPSLSRLWCRRLALGFRASPTMPPEIPRKPVAHIAVATRMVETLADIDSEGNQCVAEIERILQAWDPWGLSSATDGVLFGILFDSQRESRTPAEIGLLSEDAAPLVIYHGHKEQMEDDSGLGIYCRYRQPNMSNDPLHFNLQKLGERRQTLVLAACQTSEIGSGEDFVGDLRHAQGYLPGVRSLSAAGKGGAWIGTPLTIDNEDGLRFARSFLHQACTRGAPVSELLRMTINDLAERLPGGYPWYTFVLHGDSHRLLPFVTKKRMYFHSTPEANSIIKELAERLRSNPIIPIDPVEHSTIAGMDSDFLRALGLEAKGLAINPSGQIWPVSVSAVGRALANPEYPSAGRRLKILSVAVYSRGGCRLVVWDPNSPEREIQDEAEVRRIAIGEDTLFRGFSYESFEGTLARMCLRWWSQREGRGRAGSGIRGKSERFRDRFHVGALREQLWSLQTAAATGVVLWGGDFLTLSREMEAKEKYGEERVERFYKLTKSRQCIDLETELWEQITGLESMKERRIPVILLVTIEEEGEGQGDYFFAFRELLRTFRDLEVETGDYLIAGKPSYFRSVDDNDLDTMSFFIAKALELGLWDLPLHPRFQGAVRRFEDLRKEVGAALDDALYLPASKVEKGISELRRRLNIGSEEPMENLLENLERLMWGGGQIFPEAYPKYSADLLSRATQLLNDYIADLETILRAKENLRYLRAQHETIFPRTEMWSDEEVLATVGENRIAEFAQYLSGLVAQSDEMILKNQLTGLQVFFEKNYSEG